MATVYNNLVKHHNLAIQQHKELSNNTESSVDKHMHVLLNFVTNFKLFVGMIKMNALALTITNYLSQAFMMGPGAVTNAALKSTTFLKLNTPTPVTVEYQVAIRSLLDIIKFGHFKMTGFWTQRILKSSYSWEFKIRPNKTAIHIRSL